MNIRTVLPLIGFLAFSTHSPATPSPGIITHQGRLATNGVNFDGPGSFKFALVGPTDPPQILWTPSGANIGQVTNDEPPAVIPVTLQKGLYSIPLGDPTFTPNMTTPIPSTIFTEHQDVRLRVWFSATGQAGSFERLAPDQRLVSTGYALNASSAERVPDDAITTAMLAAGSITADKIAPGAINKLDSPDGMLLGVASATNGGTIVIGDSGTPVDQVLQPAGTTPFASANDIAVQGDFAYVATDIDFRVYDLSDPHNPVLRGVFPVPAGPLRPLRAVAVDGGAACTVGGINQTLSIYKISDPDNILPLGSGASGAASADDVELKLSGTLAFVTTFNSITGGDFTIIDISNPAAPNVRGSLPSLTSPVLDVAGDYAYVIDFPTGIIPVGDKLLQVLDISNPDVPRVRGSRIVNSLSSADLLVRGSTLFLTGNSAEGLQTFDVSAPDTIVPLDSNNTNLASPREIAVSGGFAYLYNSADSTVRVFDATDPSNLIPLPSAAAVPAGASGFGTTSRAAVLSHLGSDTPILSTLTLRPARLVVDGALQLEGPLLDSSGLIGSPGQVLSGSEGGTAWIDLDDNNPVNELQTLSLAGSNLQLSDGGNVPLATLAAAFPPGSLPGSKIATGSVGAAQIQDGGVTASELAAGSVSTAALQNDAVTNAKIAAGAVDATALATNAVTSGKIAPGAVTEGKIGADAVTGFQIASGSILSSDILDGTITGADIANGTITGSEIQNSTITGLKIENGSLTRSDLAASTLTGAEILNESLTGADVQNGTLTGADITNGSITGADITNATLTLNGDLEIGASSASDDDSIIFDGSSSLRWDNAEIRFIFSAGLAVNGPLTAGFGAIGDDAPFHFFSDVVPTPDSGDMSNTGDVYIRNDLEVDGSIYADSGVVNGSDRNRKENIAPIDPGEALQKVAGLPISRWNYIDDDSKRPHIGPMAQDFHAAFQLGKDDKRISALDLDGVTIAAIQGLNAKLETENADLRARLEKLERAMQALSNLKTEDSLP